MEVIGEHKATPRAALIRAPKRALRWAGWTLEAIPFFLLLGFFRVIGLEAASFVGGWLGRALGPLSPAHRTARRNIERALPELAPEQVAATLNAMWDNLGRTFAEYPHLRRFTGFPNRRVQVVGLEHACAAATGNGAILVTGHFANWEVLALSGYQCGLDGAGVYRPVNNPLVDAWILWQRRRCGYPLQISKTGNTVREMLRVLKANKYIGLLADQKHREGEAVPYFGRDAMTVPGPAVLSLRTGAALAPVSMERIKGTHFRMTFRPKMETATTGDKAADILAVLTAVNAWLEQAVRAHPPMWLWAHDRWMDREKN